MAETVQKWFEKAERDGFAIGAFNVANLESFKAVVAAAVAEASPVLIESSDGETAYVGADNLVDLVKNAREETGLPIFLNLDHSRSFEAAQAAIEAGYDLIHFDGSKQPAAKNQEILTKVVAAAHPHHILVEGEHDYIIEGSEVRSISADEGRAKSHLTDPAEAEEFVRASGIDTFAVSIGNVHGLYTTPKHLDLDLLAGIRARLSCFLSLHGGSGISDDQISAAITIGRVVKINISTELRQAFRYGLEEQLQDEPTEMAMYKLTPAAIADMQAIVAKKMQLFGSSGRAT